jgi:hypothetical protein
MSPIHQPAETGGSAPMRAAGMAPGAPKSVAARVGAGGSTNPAPVAEREEVT